MRTKKSKKRFHYPSNFSRSELVIEPGASCEVDVGLSLRTLREESGISLRALAEKSGLSVNTLSLIENRKTSPSVGTLQKISAALNVPMIAFFLSNQIEQKIHLTKSGEGERSSFCHGSFEDLGAGLSQGLVEPLIVTLKPHADSWPDPIAHEGYEFVFCLAGRIAYVVDKKMYTLEPGDSLFFEANLPHCWQNLDSTPSKNILVLCSIDGRDHPIDWHFKPE